MSLRRSIICLSLLFAFMGPALAQQDGAPAPPQIAGQAMLVLDASGSMWGQIEGQNKIVIARQVIGDLLQDWSPDMALGAESLNWAESPAYRLVSWHDLFQSLPGFVGNLPVWPVLLALSALMYMLAPRRKRKKVFGRR